MRSIGYREAGRLLRGECSEGEALEELVRRTERLAKRQRTWFRAEPEAVWFDPQRNRERILEAVQQFLTARAAAL
jgi:tRNA dimethylallyltransferase